MFCAVIIAATLYYSPWWGVVDDAGNLAIAADFWKHPSIGLIYNHIEDFVVRIGRFMPLYMVWRISAYSLFRDFPAGLYLVIALACLVTLLVWGKIINKVFPDRREAAFNLFVYPLSFIIFTPFWNNFTIISGLEKFIYIFSAFSIYCYIRAYETNRISYLAASAVFMILVMLSKETGVVLAGAYCIYALLDCAVFRKNRKLSLTSFALSAFTIAGFYLLVLSIWDRPASYSTRYMNNFNGFVIFASILSAPLAIKGLFFTALTFFCVGIALIIRNKDSLFRQEYLLFPLLLGAYIIILSPWGFVNYLLAPIAPFAMMTVYPAYVSIGAGSMVRRRASESILIVLIFLVLFFVDVPRISKMGDTKKVVAAIISINDSRLPARFFLAPPFAETARNLEAFTNTGIATLHKGSIDRNMLDSGSLNYIIFEDRCDPVALYDVAADEEVYHNMTWKIFSLKKAAGNTQVFMPAFDKNLLQRIKDRIKVIH
jgi:hypothetical protein